MPLIVYVIKRFVQLVANKNVYCYTIIIQKLRGNLMNKRYSIFISSTKEDLNKERQAIINAAVKKKCTIECMEFFYTQERAPWEVIQESIDSSDIFVLLIGGVYGSRDPDTNIGFTEREFDYAKEKGKYIMPLIRGGYKKLQFYKNNNNDEDRDSLDDFMKKVQDNRIYTISYWKNKVELVSSFDNSFNEAINHEKMKKVGWIKKEIFPGFCDIFTFPKEKKEYYPIQNKRSSSKIKAIQNTKSLKIVLHTGGYFFANSESDTYGSLESGLGAGLEIKAILLQPYSLYSMLIANYQQENSAAILAEGSINEILNKNIQAYCGVIDDKIKDTIIRLIRTDSHPECYLEATNNRDSMNGFFKILFDSIAGINALMKKFPNQIEFKLLPTHMTMSLMITDTECYIEPYALPVTGNKSKNTFELHIDKGASEIYANISTNFDYLWNISDDYNIDLNNSHREFYKNKFGGVQHEK